MPNEASHRGKQSEKLGRIGPRPEWVRTLSLLCRAAHQVGAAIFLAAYLIDGVAGPPRLYVLLAFVSGGLLLGAECWRHRQYHRELVGAVTLGKLIILGAAWHALLPSPPLVLLAFLLASIGAHLPKAVRHRLLY